MHPCLVLTAILFAVPTTSVSADLVDLARADLARGDHAAALANIERAYVEMRDPVLIWNLARIHERAGDLQRALETYRRFLDSGHVEPELVERARERILVLERGPEPQPLPVKIASPPPAAALVAPPSAAPAGVPFEAKLLFGTSGAALIGSVVFGLTALSASSDARASVVLEEKLDHQDAASARAIGADVLLGVAVVAAGLGAYFMFGDAP